MKRWGIWSEGFAATGEAGTAQLHGTETAETFREACIIFFTRSSCKYFDQDRMTHWSCRLFDNETGARKKFG